MINSAIVRGIYDSFAKGEFEENLQHMHENVIWAHPEHEEIPFGRVFNGHNGVREFFELALASLDVLDQQVYDIVDGGDTVVALGSERMVVKKNGLEYFTLWSHVYTFTGGKVSKFQEYVDSAAMVKAFSGVCR